MATKAAPVFFAGKNYTDDSNFINEFTQLSRSDGKHDGFVENEFSFYFPNGSPYANGEAGAGSQILNEDNTMSRFFGNYNGNVPNTSLVDTSGPNRRLIPNAHGLTQIITNQQGMGYKFASLRRDRSDNGAGSNVAATSFVQKLQTMGIPADGREIYLFVDQAKGILDILNKVPLIGNNSSYNFTVVFNRATITDPAPNTLPTTTNAGKKKNRFSYTRGQRIDQNVVGGRTVRFAIEDLDSSDLVIDPYPRFSDITGGIDYDDKMDVLGRTLVSKYKLCLSYANPSKVGNGQGGGGRGPNPKEMKAVLLVYDTTNNRVRIMDSKSCEKKSSHTGANGWFKRMKNRIRAKFKKWLGDSSGGTHALGKKSGDWLQVYQTMNPDINIHTLNQIDNPLLGSKRFTYSARRPVPPNAIRAIVTHDRNEKTYALLCGAPVVIFAKEAADGLPQFYEIYVKDYLTTISPGDFNSKKAEVRALIGRFNDLRGRLVGNAISNLKTNLSRIIGLCQLELDKIGPNAAGQNAAGQNAAGQNGPYILPNITNGDDMIQIITGGGDAFDRPYIGIISALNYINVIFTLSELKDFNVPIQNTGAFNQIDTFINNFTFDTNNNANNRTNYESMLTYQVNIEKSIAMVQKFLRMISGNERIVADLNTRLNGRSLIDPDIRDNCAIFKFKGHQTGSVLQNQLFIHENIGYSSLENIIKMEDKLTKLVTNFRNVINGVNVINSVPSAASLIAAMDNLKVSFTRKREYLLSGVRGCLRVLNNNYSDLKRDFNLGGAQGVAFAAMARGVGFRRLSPEKYLAYVELNLEGIIGFIDVSAQVMIGGAIVKRRFPLKRVRGRRAPRKFSQQRRQQIANNKLRQALKSGNVAAAAAVRAARQTARSMTRARVKSEMKTVLYNYTMVFDNYLTFLLIELSNGGDFNVQRFGITSEIVRFLRQNNAFFAPHGPNWDQRPVVHLFLNILNARYNRFTGNDGQQNGIDNFLVISELKNKIRMFDMLFVDDDLQANDNDVFRTTVNNIDIYSVSPDVTSNTALSLQVKQIEWLNYFVYARAIDPSGSQDILTPWDVIVANGIYRFNPTWNDGPLTGARFNPNLMGGGIKRKTRKVLRKNKKLNRKTLKKGKFIAKRERKIKKKTKKMNLKTRKNKNRKNKNKKTKRRRK
jgi:hypothetical protein